MSSVMIDVFSVLRNDRNWKYDFRFPQISSLRAFCASNILRPRRKEQYFADDIFKCIFFYENVWISIKISPKFIHKGPINNIPALVQIMAWRRPGDKPLSEPMMVSLPTHICVTRPQWVNLATRLTVLEMRRKPLSATTPMPFTLLITNDFSGWCMRDVLIAYIQYQVMEKYQVVQEYSTRMYTRAN